MAKKRSRGGDAADNPRKRLRIVHETPTAEDVHTSRQLMQLLAFEQDLTKARHGLQSFKLFLDGLTAETGPKDEDVDILKEYLESTRPRHDDAEAMYLPDIIETWSFAAQMNNDNIMSAVPVVLALLLKFLSQRLDLVSHGLGIGRTILQKRPQELIARNLATDKGKEFIISPTLRLLREAICFDGGALAKPIFRARNNTFKALARNMGIRFLGDGLEEVKRPSARTTAIRFFLSAVKFLHLEAKIELLSQREIGPALTKHLRDDPPYLVFEILDTLKSHVLKDDKLPANIKGKLLNSNTLSRLASLYNYEHPVPEESKMSVEDSVHSFLIFACTTPNAGILRPHSGFYPRGIDPDAPLAMESKSGDEQGLGTISWMNQFTEEVPVRNLALLDFIQQLRPWSNMKHSELIIAIFEAASELVCPYFLAKKSFTFEPKLSATWIGYAAFIFNTIQLPIPPQFGNKSSYARVPPPTSVIIDNIIPLPLNQKVLRRCLTQQSDLIPFFATRLLVISLQKLRTALRLHNEAQASSASKNLWTESVQQLVNEFCQRAPDIKDIFNTYRGIPEADLLQREAASRVLRLYYEVIPQVALAAKFDVSPLLIAAIARLDQFRDSPQDHALVLVELDNLLAIAGYSPGMKWFSKSEILSLSPYTALLKVVLDAPEGVSLQELKDVLGSVSEEHQLVLPQKGHVSLNALLGGLQRTKRLHGDSVPSELWRFLENCATRCAGSPIKYLEMMEDTVTDTKPKKKSRANPAIVSPLALTILEQFPFVKASASEETLVLITHFVSGYFSLSKQAGEDKRSLKAVIEKLVAVLPDKHAARKHLKLSDEGPVQRNLESWGADFSAGETSSISLASSGDDEAISDDSLENLLMVPVPDTDNSALSKWASKEADEVIEEGYASALINLLGSEHVSIRKEALTSILKIAAKVQESTYEEKEQVWLLLSELAETSKPQLDAGPLSSTIIAFATHALDVIKNPLHFLYGKINTFLTRGPTWALDKFPLVHDIVQEGPEVDDSYYTELGWLFSYLLDGLYTTSDMALFHKRRLFERLLSLAGNPYIRHNLKMEILKILYRATCIEGGSTTLVTRFGIVSWLEAQEASAKPGPDAGIYKALLRRIWQTCDQDKVSSWSRQGIKSDSS